jgi:hypothetical protein
LVLVQTLFLIICLSSSTVLQAAVTLIDSLYAYPTDNELFFHPGNAVTDGTTLLSDAYVGLSIDINSAKNQDKWEWEFIRSDGTGAGRESLKFVTAYGNLRQCFVFAWGGEYFCNTTGGRFEVAAPTACRTIGMWNVRLTYTPADGSPVQVFENPFEIKSSGPQVTVGVNPSSIKPKIIGGNGIPNLPPETTKITSKVTDSGCPNIPLPDVSVVLQTITVPGSGGHLHLGEQAGTGIFGNKMSAISGVTDSNGVFSTDYSSGIVGVKERVTAVATKNMAGRGEPENVMANTNESMLTIKIPNMVPLMPSDRYELYQSPSGEDAHKENYYGTPGLIAILWSVSGLWRDAQLDEGWGEEDLITLSINDMSLPNGGVFDVCGSLQPNCPSNQGHVSHELGNDVDLNLINRMGLNKVERDLVVEIFREHDPGCRYIHDYHFRCDSVLLERAP